MAIRITNNNYGGRMTLSSRNIGGRFVNQNSPPTQYLLNYYPEAAAAYSLRLLNNNYTGSAIRVRRSSDNAETDIGFTSGQLNTTALLSFCGAGNGFVTTWYDQSGNGRNAVQVSAGGQPPIVTSGAVLTLNSKPCLSFNNVGSLSVPSFSLVSDVSYFMVQQRTNAAQQGLVIGNTGGFGALFGQWNDSNIYFQRVTNSGGFYIGAADTATSRQLLEAYSSGSSMSMYKNGVAYSATAPAPFSNTSTTFNSIGYASGYISHAFGQEVIVYTNSQLTNRLGITNDINNYYRIYGWQGTGTALLDLYPSPAVAYSLRNLSSNYVGPLVRVRRSSDSAEADIYGTAAGQIDSGSMLAFCGAGNGFVTKWYDQSGKGNNAIQTTAASQPQIVTSGAIYTQGTKPSMFFNSHFLSFTGVDVTSDIAYFMVSKTNGPAQGLSIGSSLDGSTQMVEADNGYFGFSKPIGNALYQNGGVTTNRNNYQILQGLSQSTTLSAYYNGTTISMGANTIIIYPIKTVDSIGKTGSKLTGDTRGQEVIIYNTNQIANRVAIVANINSYYAVY